MAKYTATFSADAANTKVCTVRKPNDSTEWLGTVYIYGTFGSGTITVFASPDGGTTKVPLKEDGGSAISATAAGMFNVRLGNGSANSDAPIIYASLAGATNPALTVAVFDNN